MDYNGVKLGNVQSVKLKIDLFSTSLIQSMICTFEQKFFCCGTLCTRDSDSQVQDSYLIISGAG